jgi:hypothetical protein
MQLKACKLVSSDDRRRKRAVQQDRSFAKEENLMAKFDQEKIETAAASSESGQVIAALHDASS